MKKYKVGYTQGVYVIFHIGHLNLLNNARDLCEHLIVGVNSDELVTQYKHKLPVIPEEERRLIVANIKAVDACEIVDTLDKVENYKRFHYDAVFIGDDWKGNARWTQTEKDLAPFGVDVVYLPHTKGVCSTELRKVEDMHVNE